MSKKLLTILLLVITVISLKIGINEAIQANIDVNVTEKGSDVVMQSKNLSKVKIDIWTNTECRGLPEISSGIQPFPQPNRVTCESTNIKKYNNVCVTTSLARDEQGFAFDMPYPSGRFNWTECPEGTGHGLPGWAIAIIVIVVIAVIVVLSWFCCCRKQQNSIQPNISPKQNLYTANLHPINQSPAYMNGETPTEGEV